MSNTPFDPANLLLDFAKTCATDHASGRLCAGVIGKDARIEGPFGTKALIYADYVASGRALMQVETFVMTHVLPYYANSHTEASFCGSYMTRLRNAARTTLARHCGADDRYAVIFAGSGATAGANRLVHLLGADSGRVKVIIGPYEHHSNILPWRESGAEVVELPEAATGGPDRDALAAALAGGADYDRVICTFSAASNVSGIIADVAGLTRQVKAAGALMVWDYAGGAPYLPIRVCPAEDAQIDALIFSPHKFIGGPGASGVFVLRRDAVISRRPTWVGGGTVSFVSDRHHDYNPKLEAREEAGTPNVVGDIRAALVVLVKEAFGAAAMARNAELSARAIAAWSGAPKVGLLGKTGVARLPILSFRLSDGQGGFVHPQLVTRILSDYYGIQARGGCACAGPYVLRLLGLEGDGTEALREAILSGDEMKKPGFTRLNLSITMSDVEVDFILSSVIDLSERIDTLVASYDVDPRRAIFRALPPVAA